jgi:hypothetical protein
MRARRDTAGQARCRTGGELDRAAEAIGPGVAEAVDRAEDTVGLTSDVFHDVDLAASGPRDGVDVRTERPDRRPQPGTGRHAQAGLDPTVSNFDFALGDDACRRVATLGRACRDREVAVTVVCSVRGIVRVPLLFAIPPPGDPLGSPVTELERPGAGIWQRSGRSIKLVTPDKVAAHDSLLRHPEHHRRAQQPLRERRAPAVSGEATHARKQHHFVYTLLPSRPTFAADTSEAETGSWTSTSAPDRACRI